jgi:hypothetical protein
MVQVEGVLCTAFKIMGFVCAFNTKTQEGSSSLFEGGMVYSRSAKGFDKISFDPLSVGRDKNWIQEFK